MSGTVYALLVGINDYGGSPSNLRGCRADVDALAAVLQGRVAPGSLQLETLLDQDATRQRIIDGFRSHLGRAGPGDVALFSYSGHGSYEPVEERFWFLEPTGQNQTIVCADSRNKRAGDLADKELNELIAGVAEKGAHVVVVLDCCHSGGGTRDPAGLPPDVGVRLAPPADEPRPLERYLPGVREAAEAAAAGRPVGDVRHARHVALSACESDQLSKEVSVGEGSRGAFSAALERALTTMPASASYRDLVRAAANEVRNRVSDQDPVVFAEGEGLDQPFLGGAVQARPAAITLEHDRDRWVIDVGSVHGIQHPRDGETTVLAVNETTAGTPVAPPGQVRVATAEPTQSVVEPLSGFVLDTASRYRAVVTSVPIPPATVEIRGDGAWVDLLRSCLGASTLVREAPAGEADGDRQRFTVGCAPDGLTVGRGDGTALTGPVPADQAGVERTQARLEHLARWHTLKDLDNPTSPLAGRLEIELVEATPGETPPPAGTRPAIAPDASGVVRRSYRPSASGWDKPYVFIYLHNRSDRDLYCTLLDLTDRFRSHSKLFPVEKVAAGATTMALGGRPIDLTVPQERLDAGGTEVRDWLKLIACEQRFESDAFDLPLLDGVLPTSRSSARSTLDRLAGRLASRELGDEAAEAPADWTTTTLCVVTEGPVLGAEVPTDGELVLADGGLTVASHPALTGARAGVGAAPSTRAADGRQVAPTALVRDPSVAVPLSVGTAPPGAERPPVHLELRGDVDLARVSRQSPIRLRLRATIDPGDVVLAVARDGEFFLPLGIGTAADGGRVDIDLHRLPAPPVQIFFQRVLGRRHGPDAGRPRLSVVGLDDGSARIAAAVEPASTVLLLVPGLLGDSRAMVPPVAGALGGRYDVVLAYDFDPVGPSVQQTAEALAEQLRAVGMAPGDGRQIDVLALSSGALVVRWFVEHLGGATLVRRAVLAGAPNQGTPWAAADGWATAMLAIGLNGLSSIVWPADVLGWVVGALERLDRRLDAIAPGSDLLGELAAPNPSGAPYVVLAGSSSLSRVAEVDEDEGRLGRLLARLGVGSSARAVFDQPNDLVVTTASIRGLPEGLTPAPAIVDVACDHLTYLHQPEALAAIAEALR